MKTEMNPQVKKEWKTPELIVLTRSKPEELVLTECKSYTLRGPMTYCITLSAFACYENSLS